jgi:very-short-patch-repair endonuclease
VVKPKGWRPLTEAEKREIVNRYAAGEVLEGLMAEYRRSKPIIRAVIADAGVAIRPRGNRTGTVWPADRREAHKLACSTPEFAEKSRQALLKRLPSMRGPATNTAIERRLQGALMKAGIGFTTQSLLLGRYLVDIEVRQARIVIEADGAQHTLREQRAKDAARDTALAEAGYRVFRFTGSEINRNAAECVKRVADECGLVPDEDPVYEIRTSFAGPDHPRWKGGARDFTCENCGTVFQSKPSQRKGRRAFCSQPCYWAAKRGQKLPAETRAKMSAAGAGRKYPARQPFTPEHRAKISAGLKGKPKSPEHAAKVAAANRGRRKSQEERDKISVGLRRWNAAQRQIKI